MTDVNAAHDTGRPASSEPRDRHDPVPAIVDWVLAGLTGLLGLAVAGIGLNEYQQVDRAEIADAVDSESVELEGLTRAEVVDAAVPFTNWFTLGVAVTGVVMMVAAATFAYLRLRTRRRVAEQGGTTATFWASAVYGGAVATLAPIPLVDLAVGGGAASAVSGSDATLRVGAAVGLVMAVLSLPMLLSLSAGLVAGAAAIGELAVGVYLAGFAVVAYLVLLAINAGLGALGAVAADQLV